MNSKRFLALLLSGVLITSSLCACGYDNEVKEKEEQETVQQTEDTEEVGGKAESEEAEEESEEAEEETEAAEEENTDEAEEADEKVEESEDSEKYDESAELTEETENEEEEAESDAEEPESEEEEAVEVPLDDEEPELPDVHMSDFSYEDMLTYFGVDINSINIRNIGGIYEAIAPFFSEDDMMKIKEMSVLELISFLKSRGELIYTLSTMIDKAELKIDINRQTGEITLDSSILFEFDKSELSDEGKDVLTKFVNIYAAVLLNDKFAGLVDGIVVEGHTDSQGTDEINIPLSEARAKNVLDFCLSEETGLSAEKRGKLGKIATSAGCASERPVYREDGTIDDDASRRVSFRFVLGVD